jgi:acetyl-CoA synthetase
MLTKFVHTSYSSYEDFSENCRIKVPENFNFAYDVADAIAEKEPDKMAMVWCDDKGAHAKFTFGEMKKLSDRTANFLVSLGIGKGDPVMLILKRRYEYWFFLLALHKIGAIAIPATHLLKAKDIIYRNNAAGIKMIVSINDPAVLEQIDTSVPESRTLAHRVTVGGPYKDWVDYNARIGEFTDRFPKPRGKAATKNSDISLLYFTSGTTGMPKMVQHNFAYPLGHILTAKFWQNVQNDGLHLTVADTGWAKAAWGKIYGQWLGGSAIFVYDYDRFVPKEMLEVITKHGVTTFCAPPTVFRYLIKEDLSKHDFSKLKYCVTAGEPLNPEVYSQWLKLTGHKLMEGYGQTECVIAVATWPWLTPKPGSMGKPSPGYTNGVPSASTSML